MWNAKCYYIGLIIAIFSGIWPYGKLLLMMFVWCLNEKILSIKSRERMLIVLDSLGKWSLIDTFVMVMMIVAFRF